MHQVVEPHADKPRVSEFGKWLTDLRRQAKLGQSELAAKVSSEIKRGCHSGRISEWETAQKTPRSDELAALKKILDPNGTEPPTPVVVPKEKKPEQETLF